MQKKEPPIIREVIVLVHPYYSLIHKRLENGKVNRETMKRVKKAGMVWGNEINQAVRDSSKLVVLFFPGVSGTRFEWEKKSVFESFLNEAIRLTEYAEKKLKKRFVLFDSALPKRSDFLKEIQKRVKEKHFKFDSERKVIVRGFGETIQFERRVPQYKCVPTYTKWVAECLNVPKENVRVEVEKSLTSKYEKLFMDYPSKKASARRKLERTGIWKSTSKREALKRIQRVKAKAKRPKP